MFLCTNFNGTQVALPKPYISTTLVNKIDEV